MDDVSRGTPSFQSSPEVPRPVDPLPSGMAITGLRGAAAPMAVRATQVGGLYQWK